MSGQEDKKLQTLMQRVWLDNSLVSAGQEMLLLANQITSGAASSEELLQQLDLNEAERRALQLEWQEKVQALNQLVGSLQQVLAQTGRELRLLGTSEV